MPDADRIRLLILTVMPSPYQRELFDAMAAHPRLDLRVRYFTAEAPDRQWGRPVLPPHSRVLPGVALHALTRCCCLNPSILREITADPADLVVVGDYFTLTSQLAMRVLSWLNVPWVLWGEAPGMSSRGRLGRALRRLAQRPVCRRASGVAAIGTRAVKAYQALVPDGVPVGNIPYHCDLSAYLAIRRERQDGPCRFLFSGQLIHRKGVDVLLRAFERVCAMRGTATLTLLGDGPDRERYRRMVSPEWRDRVRFAGFVQPSALPRAFADADVFVLPSRYDGWGVVVNEAIAAGMPVIASSAVGAAADLVEPGRNGFVVPPADIDALAAAMDACAARPSLVASFASRSREIAADWTVDRGAERWYDFCRAILDRRPAHGSPGIPGMRRREPDDEAFGQRHVPPVAVPHATA